MSLIYYRFRFIAYQTNRTVQQDHEDRYDVRLMGYILLVEPVALDDDTYVDTRFGVEASNVFDFNKAKM